MIGLANSEAMFKPIKPRTEALYDLVDVELWAYGVEQGE